MSEQAFYQIVIGSLIFGNVTLLFISAGLAKLVRQTDRSEH
jgi:hypothetical protein